MSVLSNARASASNNVIILSMLIQAVVTISLLAFSYLLRHDQPGLSSTVVGFAAAHWLSESKRQGQQIANNAKDGPNG